MKSLQSVVSYLDTYLDIHAVKDGCWNGLQFEGSSSVEKILFAVDTGAETFERAVEEQADMIVVHHGLFWANVNPSLTAVTGKRVAILYKHNISLYACHLPLDVHAKVGNNAGIVSLIGAAIDGDFAVYNGTSVGYTGRFKKPVTLAAIIKKLNASLATTCTVLPFGPKKITRIGVISGSGSLSHMDEAVAKKLDLFITGEQMDVYHTARDAGINVLFAGHHATETVGVKLLAEHVRKKLSVGTVFVDIPTGL